MRSLVTLAPVSLLLALGCGADDPAGTGGAGGATGAGGDGGATSCDPAAEVCTALFGRPNAATGLDERACRPRLECGAEVWEAPEYDAAFVAGLRATTLLDPPATLAADPYAEPAPTIDPDAVCAARFEADGLSYRLETFATEQAARDAGAKPTHFGPCGLCSSLVDLAVYVEQPDLTEPVRACGLQHLSGTQEEHEACLLALGFTEPCARIWYFNTKHTRAECAEPCFAALGQPYHLPTGELNDCLRCDEEKSGDVFKAIAGRTRRNTGLANALCRPCDEVRPLVHDYP